MPQNGRLIRFSTVCKQKFLSILNKLKEKYHPRQLSLELWVVNHKGADQHAHLSSLIRALVFCLLKSGMSRLATSTISIFRLGFCEHFRKMKEHKNSTRFFIAISKIMVIHLVILIQPVKKLYMILTHHLD